MKQKTDNTYLLVILLGLSFLSYAYATSNNENTKTQIITAVIGLIMLVAGWKWGSSKSSAVKDETIKAMQQEPGVKADTVNVDTVNNLGKP